MAAKKIVIVGGVAGGATAAARLRRLDEQAEIIMLERGSYISYANCGLPYYIGGEIADESALTLQTPTSFRARFQVDVRVDSEVTAIDRARKSVTVKTVAGQTYAESYDQLILALGAAPIQPPLSGLDSERVFTLRTIPDTFRLKEYIATHTLRRAVIVGGGYIGVEMAENLRAAGLQVSIVEMADQLIAPLDYDMACGVHTYLEQQGIELHLGRAVQAVAETAEGLWVSLDEGGLSADLLVLAVGVRPESGLAREAGLDLNARGGILVDDAMRTADADIYAVGDAVEIRDFIGGGQTMIALAGPANKQARIAADQICGIDSRYRGAQGSAILKIFEMTVATTGLNEKTAQRLGLACDKCYTYSPSHAGYYPGARNMAVKTLFDPASGKILGAQLVGYEGVDKRCDVLATAIRFGSTAYDLTELELCYAPPYSSAKDPVNMVGYVIENLLTGKLRHFHWHELADLPQDGSVTLLDTRSEQEFARGSLPGFRNIPLDQLRGRLQELDRGKPVYVSCQIGQRGYIACRILSQHGFNCTNLDGGYRLCASIFSRAKPNAAPAAAPPAVKPGSAENLAQAQGKR